MNLLKEKGWSLAYLTEAYLFYSFLKVNVNMQPSPKFDLLVLFFNLFESIKIKKIKNKNKFTNILDNGTVG